MQLRQLLVIAIISLSFISPVNAAPDGPDRLLIHEMRVLASSICANVLVFYNQSGSPFVEQNRQSYEGKLLELNRLSSRLDRPVITERVHTLLLSVDRTSKLPQSGTALRARSPGFTLWLLPVVEAHAQLQHELDLSYRNTEPASGEADPSDLHNLRHHLGELMVGYQVAAFSRLGAEQWVMTQNMVVEHDQQVLALFEELISAHPEQTQTLERARRYYVFTRQLLLNQTGNWAPNAVERFVSLALVELDTLGAG
tara:strand:- start:9086 stop:9850 length:765 start_codon:yes stop_codon:yes gene_type:complete